MHSPVWLRDPPQRPQAVADGAPGVRVVVLLRGPLPPPHRTGGPESGSLRRRSPAFHLVVGVHSLELERDAQPGAGGADGIEGGVPEHPPAILVEAVLHRDEPDLAGGIDPGGDVFHVLGIAVPPHVERAGGAEHGPHQAVGVGIEPERSRHQLPFRAARSHLQLDQPDLLAAGQGDDRGVADGVAVVELGCFLERIDEPVRIVPQHAEVVFGGIDHQPAHVRVEVAGDLLAPGDGGKRLASPGDLDGALAIALPGDVGGELLVEEHPVSGEGPDSGADLLGDRGGIRGHQALIAFPGRPGPGDQVGGGLVGVTVGRNALLWGFGRLGKHQSQEERLHSETDYGGTMGMVSRRAQRRKYAKTQRGRGRDRCSDPGPGLTEV
jgi:hypothetical protein